MPQSKLIRLDFPKSHPSDRYISLKEAANRYGKKFVTYWNKKILDTDKNELSETECLSIIFAEKPLRDSIVDGKIIVFIKRKNGSLIPLNQKIEDFHFSINLLKGQFSTRTGEWQDGFVLADEFATKVMSLKPPKKKTKFAKHDWETITFEAWRYTFLKQIGFKQTDLVRHLIEWCSEKHGDHAPDDTSIRNLARHITEIVAGR